jgi:agmatine deiminase
VRAIDWEFNAWGGLVDGIYFPWDKDDHVARKVCEIERVDSYRAKDFVLEGGSIHVDGEGTLITTEECLLSPGRNPHLSREEIEAQLAKYLAIEKVIWLKQGIYLDETNGHVDNICNYVKPGEVVLAWTDDTSDPQYALSAENLKILQETPDARGRTLKVHKLHVPRPIMISQDESGGVDVVEGTLPRREGDRLAASYVNFYTANAAVILPVFDDPHDADAIALLEKLFPEREIVPLFAREILLGGGNIHCITQQVTQAS